jgi:hypothetical protein
VIIVSGTLAVVIIVLGGVFMIGDAGHKLFRLFKPANPQPVRLLNQREDSSSPTSSTMED